MTAVNNSLAPPQQRAAVTTGGPTRLCKYGHWTPDLQKTNTEKIVLLDIDLEFNCYHILKLILHHLADLLNAKCFICPISKHY